MRKWTNRERWPIGLVAMLLVAVSSITTLSAQETVDEALDLITAPAGNAGLTFLNEGNQPNSVEDLRAMEQAFADVIDAVTPATVNVAVDEAQGSGVIVSRDGYVLTAAHVISRPNLSATITFADGSKAKAITLGTNSRFDSGLLKITDEGKWPFLDIGESDPLRKGQWVMAIGHPGGLTDGRGLVYRVGRIIQNASGSIKTDCTLVGGDSGGPLVDLDGYVIGIHSRIGGRLWDNFHVPIDRFSNDWDGLVEGVIFGSELPLLGVSFSRVNKSTIEIEAITDNEAADKAGMKVGDVIVSINDNDVKTRSEFEQAMKKLKPKDEITIVVKRGDEEVELNVTLGYKTPRSRFR